MLNTLPGIQQGRPSRQQGQIKFGGSANQQVILQGHVGFSCCQVSQRYCQF